MEHNGYQRYVQKAGGKISNTTLKHKSFEWNDMSKKIDIAERRGMVLKKETRN